MSNKPETPKKATPTPKKRAKYNWVEIRAEYVEAPSEDARPTQEELAKSLMFGCRLQYSEKPSFRVRHRLNLDNGRWDTIA